MPESCWRGSDGSGKRRPEATSRQARQSVVDVVFVLVVADGLAGVCWPGVWCRRKRVWPNGGHTGDQNLEP